LRGFRGLVALAREAETVERLLEEVASLSTAVEIEAVDEWLAACQSYDDALRGLRDLEDLALPAQSLSRCLRSVAAVEESLEWALTLLAEEREAVRLGAGGAASAEPT